MHIIGRGRAVAVAVVAAAAVAPVTVEAVAAARAAAAVAATAARGTGLAVRHAANWAVAATAARGAAAVAATAARGTGLAVRHAANWAVAAAAAKGTGLTVRLRHEQVTSAQPHLQRSTTGATTSGGKAERATGETTIAKLASGEARRIGTTTIAGSGLIGILSRTTANGANSAAGTGMPRSSVAGAATKYGPVPCNRDTMTPLHVTRMQQNRDGCNVLLPHRCTSKEQKQ